MNAAGATPKRRICLGVFAGAHGIRGDVKIRTYTERPENIAAYGPVETEDGARRFTLEVTRVLKPGLVLVRAPEIESREDAAALSGAAVYVDRDRLRAPEGDEEFYIEDLVGLSVFDEAGAPAGAVVAADDFGARLVLELSGVPGRKGPVLVPFTKAAAPEVDIAGGRITIAREFLHEEGESQNPPASTEYIEAAMREEDA
ncbi:MAG: ribosome maturation factor RimM [Parvularculaceae bacterium]